jgi:DNA-binding NarL/FixJ family response regulator
LSLAAAPSGLSAVVVLHDQLLVADATAAALVGLVPRMRVQATTDPSAALDALGPGDVLVAAQHLIPSGLRWHRLGADDGAPRFVCLGELQDAPGPGAALRALKAGALAWVPATAGPDVLLHALEVVYSEQVWMPTDVMSIALRQLQTSARNAVPASVLTEREQTVLELIAMGRTNREMARLLFLSPNTIRTHRQRLFHKLGVHSAVEAAAWLNRN